MTLLHIDGFEGGDFTTKCVAGGANLLRSATTRHGYGFSATHTVTNINWSKAVTPSAKVTVGFAVRMGVFNGSLGSPDCVFYADGGVRDHVGFLVTVGGAVSIARGGVALATSATGLVTLNTWNYFEFTTTISDTVGVASVKLNGVEVVTFTGDTKNAGTSTNIDVVLFKSGTSGNPYFWDDLYILNDLGSAPNNAPLGDVRVYNSVPTGAGNSTQLTPSTGSNWDAVDELPPSATDYVQGSVIGNKDLYQLADLPAGIATIFGIQTTVMAKKTDAGARLLKHVVRSGGTDYADTAVALSTSDTTTTSVRQVDPATSAAWTLANVNAAEIGVEIA
jgi:hypothetical protein